MTRRRKLWIAAVLLATIVVGVFFLPSDDKPPITVKFVRYEDNGKTVVTLITNHASLNIQYSCFYSIPKGVPVAQGGILTSRQGSQLYAHSSSTAWPSRIEVGYTELGFRTFIIHLIGIDERWKRIFVDLPPPPRSSSKTVEP